MSFNEQTDVIDNCYGGVHSGVVHDDGVHDDIRDGGGDTIHVPFVHNSHARE